MPTIRLPGPLRRYSGGAASLLVAGATVGAALDAAFGLYPELRPRLLDDRGEVHRHLAVFRNGTELPRSGLAQATLGAEDTLTLLEAVGGGSG